MLFVTFFMSLLEDRILRIVELKEQGFENLKIAEAMELSENSVERYYESVRISLTDFEFSPKYDYLFQHLNF